MTIARFPHAKLQFTKCPNCTRRVFVLPGTKEGMCTLHCKRCSASFRFWVHEAVPETKGTDY